MLRRLANLTLDTMADLPRACRGCVAWELNPQASAPGCVIEDPALEKEAWVSRTLLEWGSCGKVVYVDDAPAGYVLYAPPIYLPGRQAFPTGPASPDAVLLAGLRVAPALTGGGLGRMLVQAAARDLAHRGVRAIETFGEHWHTEPAPADAVEPAATRCVAPADFFVSVGFKTIRPHPRYPRLRLELRTAPSWHADVGYALQDEFAWAAGWLPDSVASRARSVLTSIEPVATSDSIG